MKTIPEDHGECERGRYPGPEVTGDHVVISGMSGLYPKSQNIQELHHILYNKINPVEKTERWSGLPEVSQYVGQISELEYFDAQFFKVHHRLSNLMDPMSRKLLEQSYQAIFDAGCSPGYLAGKKVGVFIGISFTEAHEVFLYSNHVKSGLGITGCGRSMCANRISYYLNLNGPSMSVDQSCASSTAALEMAYDAMVRGECEAAIVGGSKLCLHSQTVFGFGRSLLRLPRYCSASGMFADAGVDDFYAIMRKKVTSVVQGVRESRNGVLKMIAERIDSALLRRLTELHVRVAR